MYFINLVGKYKRKN